jgi:sigma-B regulation protein RsbU (phosphoserine phosphatase)
VRVAILELRGMSIVPAAEVPRSTELKRPYILVVDDDTAALRMLSLALSSSPFEIDTCPSAEGAMQMISTRVPDLIVLDFEMPDHDGAEVCRWIRSSEAPDVHNLPIIMLTAHSGETEELRCLDAGANDFVSKPVSAAILEARIQTQLRLRSHARELEHWNKLRTADLACARSLQQSLVPQTIPPLGDWTLQTHYKPLIEVGGDMYGWEQLPDGRCLVWLADAIGHGTAAALITALTAHLFSKASELAVSPSEVLGKVNREFARFVSGQAFMTACCAIVADDGSAIFASVGQPPLLVRRASGKVESFASDKAMLGVNPNLKPDENAVSLSTGDTLLLYTDGLYSLRGPDGEKLMPEVVEQALAEGPLGEEIIPDLLARLANRSNGAPGYDDLAVIALRRVE